MNKACSQPWKGWIWIAPGANPGKTSAMDHQPWRGWTDDCLYVKFNPFRVGRNSVVLGPPVSPAAIQGWSPSGFCFANRIAFGIMIKLMTNNWIHPFIWTETAFIYSRCFSSNVIPASISNRLYSLKKFSFLWCSFWALMYSTIASFSFIEWVKAA